MIARPLYRYWLSLDWGPSVLADLAGPVAGGVRLPFASLSIDGTAVLVVADSHGGKSTLIAEALLADGGAGRVRLIDDNDTWIDRRGRSVALGRPMMLRTGALTGADANAPVWESAYRFSDGAMLLKPRSAARTFSRHRIGALVVIEKGSDTTACDPMDSDRAGQVVADILKRRRGRVPPGRDVTRLHHIVHAAPLGSFRLRYGTARKGAERLCERLRQST